MATWHLYLARCADGSLYCGIARDVAARIAAHDAGKGARYTRGRGPLTLLLTRRCKDHGHALRLELAVKALSRQQKLAAVARPRRFDALARDAWAENGAKRAKDAILSKLPGKNAVSSPPRRAETARPARSRRRPG